MLCLLMVASEPFIVTWWGVRGCGRDCDLDSRSAATTLCPAGCQAELPNRRVLIHLLIFLAVICGFCGSGHLSCPGAELWEPCWGVWAALSVQSRVSDACSGLPLALAESWCVLGCAGLLPWGCHWGWGDSEPQMLHSAHLTCEHLGSQPRL